MHRCTPAFLGAFPRLPVPGRTVPPPSARRAVCTAGSVDGPAAACRSASVSFRMCGPMPGGLPVLPCVWAHGSSAVCTAGSMPACWDGRLPGRKSETETARMGTPFWCPLWLHSSRVPRHCLCLDRSLRPLCPPSAGGPRRVPDRGARGPAARGARGAVAGICGASCFDDRSLGWKPRPRRVHRSRTHEVDDIFRYGSA